MCLITQDRPQGWSVEATSFHGPNVVICEFITNRKQNPIISAYLPPSTLEHLPEFEETLTLLQEQETIVIGDLRSDIGKPHNLCSQQVADLFTEFGMIEILHHFRKRWRYQHIKTWLQVRQGRSMWANSNYILGTDLHRFEMVGISGVRN